MAAPLMLKRVEKPVLETQQAAGPSSAPPGDYTLYGETYLGLGSSQPRVGVELGSLDGFERGTLGQEGTILSPSFCLTISLRYNVVHGSSYECAYS